MLKIKSPTDIKSVAARVKRVLPNKAFKGDFSMKIKIGGSDATVYFHTRRYTTRIKQVDRLSQVDQIFIIDKYLSGKECKRRHVIVSRDQILLSREKLL